MKEKWLSSSKLFHLQFGIFAPRLISTASAIHTTHEPAHGHEDSIVNAVRHSLRKGFCWDSLSREFNSVPFNTSIVDKVLLQLKEPRDVRLALGFFHWSAQHCRSQHEITTYSLAIHILVKAKLIKDAQALLESALSKSQSLSGNSPIRCFVDSLIDNYKTTDSTPLVFDLLVQTCSKLRMIENAIDICWYLDEHGFTLSLITYNTLLHVIRKSDQTHLVWKIYEHMIKKRAYPNEETVKIMVGALCKEGELQKFVDMVERIHGKKGPSPGMVVNTRLVFGMVNEGRVEEGLVLLKRMLQKNMVLDNICYSLIVYGRLKRGTLESACEIYEEMLKRGFDANAFLHTLFIGAHSEQGRIKEAITLMQEMETLGMKPFDETFNHLIEGCSEVGELEESLKFCEKMTETGLIPSRVAFNNLVRKLCENGDAKRANAMFTMLLNKGFVPDEFTYSHLIAGHGREGDMQEVFKIYFEMEYRSLSTGSWIFSSLIVTLCESGELEEAEKYLMFMNDRLLVPSVDIFKALIAAHLEKGNKTRARHLYREMERRSDMK